MASPAPAAPEQCSVLAATTCAETCVPQQAGSSLQDFSCGDWWTNAKCCNGTESVSFTTTSTYFRCRCESEGMTIQGIAVIAGAAFVSALVVLSALVYVLHRKRRKLEAETEEHNRAVEEAQVYLPR